MKRRGVSLSMGYAIAGLILITLAAVVVAYITGFFGNVKQTTGNQLSAQSKQLVRNNCLSQKVQKCGSLPAGSDAWADSATYRGTSCRAWHKKHDIFGGGSGVPTC